CRAAPRLRPPTDRTGPADLVKMITDVPGLRVGHAAVPIGLTGVTVVLCDRPATGGVALRGGANDVVGLDYLHPRHLVTTVNGAVLGGGSRFGEEAIYGVMRWPEERGVGFTAGPAIVPHVPGAFLFDLGVGDRRARPTREMGYEAAARAVAGAVAEGSVGAGAGASVGKIHGIARAMRGGIGRASVRPGGRRPAGSPRDARRRARALAARDGLRRRHALRALARRPPRRSHPPRPRRGRRGRPRDLPRRARRNVPSRPARRRRPPASPR